MTPELRNSRFMRAARCEPADTTPVWLMRQAGRYLPEYMTVRSKVKFLELCQRPDLAAEVTLSAQQALGVDAAILFADLLPILQPMGLELDYEQGDGPVIRNPLKSAADVDRLRAVGDVEELGYVFETVRLVRRQLPADIPLLGFAGAPFTLASYALEGGGSRNFVRTKTFMHTEPEAWQTLMHKLSDSLARYLAAQIDAGCQAVQVFDSWAGCLSPADYRRYVLLHTRAVISALPADVPVINFLTGNPALVPLMREAGGQIVGLDWRVDLKDAWKTVGHDVAVQGNLDPVALFGTLGTLREATQAVMNAAEGRPGHIFNLGHGIMPGVDPENAKALVKMVHEMGRAPTRSQTTKGSSATKSTGGTTA